MNETRIRQWCGNVATTMTLRLPIAPELDEETTMSAVECRRHAAGEARHP